uniref:Uncharacterized protein n=1 Tax=Populus trichocarpa TaxID=3694 RepID=A0A2K1YR86_POPTR
MQMSALLSFILAGMNLCIEDFHQVRAYNRKQYIQQQTNFIFLVIILHCKSYYSKLNFFFISTCYVSSEKKIIFRER